MGCCWEVVVEVFIDWYVFRFWCEDVVEVLDGYDVLVGIVGVVFGREELLVVDLIVGDGICDVVCG